MTAPAIPWMTRGAAFLLLWLILAGFHIEDVPAIVGAVGAATWVSLRLLPARTDPVSLTALARLALRFPVQSLRAGIDVAVRALNPRLPLQPGFVIYRPAMRSGIAHDAFCGWASLIPGTVPTGDDAEGALVIHCLDTSQQTQAQLRAEELVFARALGKGGDDD